MNRGAVGISTASAVSVHCYGMFDTLQSGLDEGKLYIHAYVAELKCDSTEWTLVSDGVRYHQTEAEIEAVLQDTYSSVTHEKISVEYDSHYPDKETCLFCKHEPIPSPCEHAHTTTAYTLPTCEQAGSKKTTCNDCSETLKDETIAALGHDMIERGEKIEPTCIKAGQNSGSICRRCGLRNGFEILPPTGEHEYDSDGKCKHCGLKETELPTVKLKQNSDGSLDASFLNMDESYDIGSQLFYVKLESNINISAVELCELVGTKEIISFVGSDDTLSESVYLDLYEIFSVDIDLNNYTLSIKGNCIEEDPVWVQGMLALHGGSLILSDERTKIDGKYYSAYDCLLICEGRYANITLNNVQGTTDINPIGVWNKNNKVTITKSVFTKTFVDEDVSWISDLSNPLDWGLNGVESLTNEQLEEICTVDAESSITKATGNQ